MRRIALVAVTAVTGCSFASTSDSNAMTLGGSGTADDDGAGGSSSSSSGSMSGGPAGDGTADGGTTTDPGDACGGCGVNASCNPARQCACDPGYAGDGTTCTVDAQLPKLTLLLPCLSDPGDGCASTACVAEPQVGVMQTMTGDPAVVYDVTFRFRGVVELKGIDGGTTDGYFNVGGTPDEDQWNLARLVVGGLDRYHLNAGPPMVEHTELLDYTQTIEVRGGQVVAMDFVSSNSCALYNHDASGSPISVPDIADPAQPYDGQFLIAEAVSIVPK